jgi:hypothetical protein
LGVAKRPGLKELEEAPGRAGNPEKGNNNNT